MFDAFAASITPRQKWVWSKDFIPDPAAAVLAGALGVVPFWDGSGSARNVLENGWNDGTLVNAPWTVNEGGLAVQVDGDTDYVDFNVNFNGATEYSYLVVGKVTAQITTTERFFMAGQLESNANGYDLGGPYFGSSNLGKAYFFPINGSIIGPGSHVFAENEIVAAVCRYKSGETNGTQIWVNGNLDAQGTVTGTPSSTYDFTLGLDWTSVNSNVDWQPMLFIPWGRALNAFECSYATRNWRDFIRPDPAKILPLFYAEQAVGVTLEPGLATFSFTGFDMLVYRNTEITPDKGTISLSPFDMEVELNRIITPGIGILSLLGRSMSTQGTLEYAFRRVAKKVGRMFGMGRLG